MKSQQRKGVWKFKRNPAVETTNFDYFKKPLFKYWQVLKLAKKIDCPPMIPAVKNQRKCATKIKKGC